MNTPLVDKHYLIEKIAGKGGWNFTSVSDYALYLIDCEYISIGRCVRLLKDTSSAAGRASSVRKRRLRKTKQG